jgi:predicted CopG family antitoxin
MTNMTLAIPDDLHQRMKKHSDIRWSEVVRKSIAQKVELLDMMEKIARKSKLTKSDVNELAHKINKDAYASNDRR